MEEPKNKNQQEFAIHGVVGSTNDLVTIKASVQMTRRKWWQIYRKGWHKHDDHWGCKWWIRYNWNE